MNQRSSCVENHRSLCWKPAAWTQRLVPSGYLSAPRQGRTLGRAMSEPDPQVRVVGAQAGAQVDVNVRVTTGGAASASAQPNARRPAETGTQPNIAGFFGKRPAPKEAGPEMVGVIG